MSKQITESTSYPTSIITRIETVGATSRGLKHLASYPTSIITRIETEQINNNRI